MERVLFVTGTGTDVGKTVATGAMLRALRDHGIRACGMKPIQTGAGYRDARWVAPDLEVHFEAMGEEPDEEYLPFMAPYCYEPACSPHTAARAAERYPDLNRILDCAERLLEHFDCLLIEGAGGIMVPIDEERMMTDVIRAFDCPSIVVATTGLGTINHSLLTIEALRNLRLPVLGVVFTDTQPIDDLGIARQNPKDIAALAQVPVLGLLEHDADGERPWEAWAEQVHGIDTIISALLGSRE